MFYLCFDGTWVHVVTEKDLLRLIYVYGDCCLLPVFWLYLGTCYDRKGSIWVDLCFYGLPVFRWYLGTCCDQKGITWVSLRLPKLVLQFLCRTCV